jgi:hypothetical protein
MSLRLTVVNETGFPGPKMLLDKIQAVGSLLLVETNSPAMPWPTGIPINNEKLPNVMSLEAENNGITDCESLFKIDGFNHKHGKIERTEKGGLHCIVSQTTMESGVGVKIIIPDGVIQYLIDNDGHQIYISTWQEITRTSTSNQPSRIMIGNGDNDDMLAYFFVSGVNPGADTTRVVEYGQYNAVNVSGDAILQAITVNGWEEGEVPSSPDSIEHSLHWGAVGPVNNNVTYVNKLQSFIFYRLYIEDLTASGRTHAQALAADQSAFNAAFSEGGRYYGDMFTDPSTIA